MDKNRVSVDELVRRQLTGHEEKEREGAWLQMRDLLDKEMPQQTAVDWRRPLMYSAAFLLMATLAIGGYKLNSGLENFLPGLSSTVATKQGNTTSVPATSQKMAPSAVANNVATQQNEPAVSSASTTSNKQAKTKSLSTANNDLTSTSAHGQNAGLAHPNTSAQSTSGKLASKDHPSRSAAASNGKSAAVNPIAKVAREASGKGKSNIGSGVNGSKLAATGTHEKNDDGTALSGSKRKSSSRQALASGQNILSSPVAAASNTKLRDLEEQSGIAGAQKGKKTKSQEPAKVAKTSNIADEEVDNDDADNNNSEGSAPGKGKVVQQTVVKAQCLSDGRHGVHFKYDTISRSKLTEQLNAITRVLEEKTDNPGGGDNQSTKGEQQLLASTSKEMAAAPALHKVNDRKIAGLEGRSLGGKMLDNLSSAFNDIKYNASQMEFTKGLTAGINGSFFGPANFSGFQFGFQGNFNFGDNFRIMTELKFFERIHNNYGLNDDYYFYEANGGSGGGYRKSKMDYDFYFSTLQSFEMPIAARYNINNFSIFGGANLSYMFGISTGAVPVPDLSTPVQVVQTVGSDSHPTLSYKDFAQRFGVGYLFGFSFKIDPKASLDFRTVQTLWDNVNSTGAKMVSHTLYNSPSVQLSLTYRLGAASGKRND